MKRFTLIIAILLAANYIFMRGHKIATSPAPQESLLETKTTEAKATPQADEGYRPAKEIAQEAKVARLRANAKWALESGYMTLKAIQAEHGRYTSDLRSIGWTPRSTTLNYKMGFLAPPNASQYMNTDSFIGEATGVDNETYKYSKEAAAIRLADYVSYCERGCFADERGFELLLVIPLDEKRLDVWLINDKKQLKLAKDGLSP